MTCASRSRGESRGNEIHTESQWRYRAYRRGLRLVKYKRDSPGYQKYGPYALVDRATAQVIAVGLDAEALERALFADETAAS